MRPVAPARRSAGFVPSSWKPAQSSAKSLTPEPQKAGHAETSPCLPQSPLPSPSTAPGMNAPPPIYEHFPEIHEGLRQREKPKAHLPAGKGQEKRELTACSLFAWLCETPHLHFIQSLQMPRTSPWRGWWSICSSLLKPPISVAKTVVCLQNDHAWGMEHCQKIPLQRSGSFDK